MGMPANNMLNLFLEVVAGARMPIAPLYIMTDIFLSGQRCKGCASLSAPPHAYDWTGE
jgi:hypothetical protein